MYKTYNDYKVNRLIIIDAHLCWEYSKSSLPTTLNCIITCYLATGPLSALKVTPPTDWAPRSTSHSSSVTPGHTHLTSSANQYFLLYFFKANTLGPTFKWDHTLFVVPRLVYFAWHSVLRLYSCGYTEFHSIVCLPYPSTDGGLGWFRMLVLMNGATMIVWQCRYLLSMLTSIPLDVCPWWGGCSIGSSSSSFLRKPHTDLHTDCTTYISPRLQGNSTSPHISLAFVTSFFFSYILKSMCTRVWLCEFMCTTPMQRPAEDRRGC